jgi:hypothetical protein
MPEEEELGAGHHDILCSKCSKGIGRMTHYGGTNELGQCEVCEGVGYECFECSGL